MVRHGESTWNKENRFTGWYDSDLSEVGVAEAQTAGKVRDRQPRARGRPLTTMGNWNEPVCSE